MTAIPRTGRGARASPRAAYRARMRPLRRPRPGPDAPERPGWADDGWEPDAAWPSDDARPSPPPRDDEEADGGIAAPPAPDGAHPPPGQRVRVRLRVGIGAAVVLVGAALVVTILVTAVQSASQASPTAPAVAHPSSATHASSDAGAASDSADGDASGDSGAGDPGAAGDATGETGGTGGSADGARTPIYVHVVGAVVSPGLYPLAPGSRVVDALTAAHGFADGADTAGVNLARVLSDGEQLVVPRQGEASAAPAPSGAAGAGGAAGGGGGTATPSAPVALNTATAGPLETLPRVGPSLAARVIAWRSAHGRFARVADLGRVPGIGDRTLASLTPLVRV